jgi:hypothetical protein
LTRLFTPEGLNIIARGEALVITQNMVIYSDVNSM